MNSLFNDVRYGFRTLAKAPGFTLFAVVALALGIGANTAVFSVVDAVLLRPLPFKDPGKLVLVWEDMSYLGFAHNTPAVGNYVEWKKQNHVFEDMAASFGGPMSLTGGGTPEQVDARSVTANLFPLLGVRPLLGRAFTSEEDRAGADRVVMLSNGLWQSRFGGDPGVVGRSIVLNGHKHTVLGIMPRDFFFPTRETDVWVPAAFRPEQLSNRGSHYLWVVARLKPGVTLPRAQAEMSAVAQRLARDYPETNTRLGAVVVSLSDQYSGTVRPALVVLLLAVGCVLLIACANVANLLLARAVARTREIAVRTALGANRLRLVRQLLTESVLLSGSGGALGILFAFWSFDLLKRLVPDDIAGSVALAVDGRVLLFAILVSLATGMLFGLAPALQASGVNLADGLKLGGTRGGAAGGRGRFASALVAGEVALALVLLIGAGLLMASVAKIRGVDPGFRPENVLTLRTALPEGKAGDYAKRVAFFEQVVERVEAIPGVEAAGYTSYLPLTNRGGTSSITIEGRPEARPGEYPNANNRIVTPNYFRAMGMPLRRGRFFDRNDTADSMPVAIVNESMARQYWPGEDVLGKRFKFGDADSTLPMRTIVGVVGDVKQMGLEVATRSEMYTPVRQTRDYGVFVPQDLAIRTRANPAALAGAVRRQIWAVDRDQPVASVRTLEEMVSGELANRRLQTALLGGFAGLALVLATLGIYSVLSYTVSRRTREIGLRMALGAQRAEVLRGIVGRGLVLAGAGVVAGLIAGTVVMRMMRTLLFGVAPTDPLVFGMVSALLLAVAALASFVPARRAMKLDPMVALRDE